MNKASNAIICIGGANVDRKFYIKEKPILGTSNPVTSTLSVGGVARNIAENLGRLGVDVSLITVHGNDADWNFIEKVSHPFMNLKYSYSLQDKRTGSYSAILDSNGDLVIALADMEIYDSLHSDRLAEGEGILLEARCIVADLNCPKETLHYLCEIGRKHNQPVAFIPVSSPKMNRLPNDLSGLTWLITNRDESETYLNCEIQSEHDWEAALEKWLSFGIKNVIITNGKHGAMIGNEEHGIFHIPSIEANSIVDVTGAGDAFSGAVLYSWLKGEGLQQIVKAGIVNAYKTLQSSFTVRQDLSPIQLMEDIKNMEE